MRDELTGPGSSSSPLNCATIRAVDVRAIEVLGVPGLILMENAASGAADVILAELAARPRDRRSRTVVVLCGAGNNGGDGFAIARHLATAGCESAIVLAAPAEKIGGDARVNYEIATRLGLLTIGGHEAGAIERVNELLLNADVVVDALLGTGSRGAPTGTIAELVRAANSINGPLKVAIDIPTGLNGDSGRIETPCFCADLTITFVAEKIGFAAAGASRVLGRVVVVGLGVPLKNLLGDEKPA
ncbi:MAG: NAD(P)H-hydrate epimerase [Phycisphaerales bacterium]|nr:NAD(P)H-hydrate epimerase [Phycisphaerales bacterium]